MDNIEIGVIGGTGFYSLIDENVTTINPETPYGMTSDKITIGDVAGKKVAFLPRHGQNHSYPPHLVPYRANIHALKELGVKKIIAINACGSLQPQIAPGDVVICDQFIDRTWGRKDTFFDGMEIKHTSMANPYNEELRQIAIQACIEANISVFPNGTVVVIQGPRFSTKAESRWFSQMGWSVINMTQYPECALANEAGIDYVNISLITDYDAGLEDDPTIQPVTHEAVTEIFERNIENLRDVVYRVIDKL